MSRRRGLDSRVRTIGDEMDAVCCAREMELSLRELHGSCTSRIFGWFSLVFMSVMMCIVYSYKYKKKARFPLLPFSSLFVSSPCLNVLVTVTRPCKLVFFFSYNSAMCDLLWACISMCLNLASSNLVSKSGCL